MKNHEKSHLYDKPLIMRPTFNYETIL
jgi:hypothetical protein